MYVCMYVCMLFSFRYFLSFSFFFLEDSNNGGSRTLRIKLAIAMNDVDSMPSFSNSSSS